MATLMGHSRNKGASIQSRISPSSERRWICGPLSGCSNNSCDAFACVWVSVLIEGFFDASLEAGPAGEVTVRFNSDCLRQLIPESRRVPRLHAADSSRVREPSQYARHWVQVFF